jgi:quercetin 2,3-dioxygenase
MKLLLSSIIICLTAIYLLYTFPNLAIKSSISSLLRTTQLSTAFNRSNLNSTSFVPKFPFAQLSVLANYPKKNMTIPRKIQKSFLAIEQSEGAGARVRRSIGTPKLRNFSPFLMLDHFTIHPGAGFPDHPHRGQETITYLLKGAVDHEDFAGNAGTIYAGDLQFMTAGRGIMHAEMPNQGFEDIVGMQLWVDLPAKLKQCEPRYRDLKSTEIPTIQVDDDKVTIKVISGQSHGTDSVQELAYTPVWLLDIDIKPGGKVNQALPAGWNAFAYTLEGTATFGTGKDAQTVPQFHNVVFEQSGDEVFVQVPEDAKQNARFSK